MPAVAVETNTGEICFVAAGADEGVQIHCFRGTMAFLLSALLPAVIYPLVTVMNARLGCL